MTLLPPRVIDPLSECSHSVRVEGQISGATVELFMSGHSGAIGGGAATWSDQTLPLLINLVPGATVQALQKLGPDTSGLGPGVTVQMKPPTIGPVVFLSHLYQCGRCVWISGAVPGAQIEANATRFFALRIPSRWENHSQVFYSSHWSAAKLSRGQQ
jgi:hypothetical protein